MKKNTNTTNDLIDRKKVQEEIDKYKNSWLAPVDGFGRSVANGLFLVGPYMDEFSAGMNATFGTVYDAASNIISDDDYKGIGNAWSKRYNHNLAVERGKDEWYENTYGKAATIGKYTGSALSILLAARAVRPMAPNMRSSPAVSGLYNKVPPVVRTVGTAGLGAAAVGGIEGFGEGEGSSRERFQVAEDRAWQSALTELGFMGGAKIFKTPVSKIKDMAESAMKEINIFDIYKEYQNTQNILVEENLKKLISEGIEVTTDWARMPDSRVNPRRSAPFGWEIITIKKP